MSYHINLRFKGYVKPEFREGFKSIALYGLWSEHKDKVFNDFDYKFIPNAGLQNNPKEWKYKESGKWVATDGFNTTWN